MSKIDSSLKDYFRTFPEQIVDLIVRTEGDITPHLEWLEKTDFQVKHQFRLSPGVALSGPCSEAMKLLDQKWVISIELDGPITTAGSQ